MKDRLIGGLFVTIGTLVMLFSGGIVSAIILAIVSLFGVYELLKVYSLEKTAFAITDYLGTIALYALLYFNQEEFILLLLIVIAVLELSIYVFKFPKYKDSDIMKAFFAFFYAALLLSFVYRVRAMEAGIVLVCYIFIASWGNDVFAYLVGVSIGKHKFSPKVSPNKSVEGFIGGIIGAGLVGYVFAILFGKDLALSGLYCAIIASLGAIPAVIGDLAASAIKRNNEIKDYSHLIPGHGGILDRFDSVLFTAPIIYYLIELFNIL